MYETTRAVIPFRVQENNLAIVEHMKKMATPVTPALGLKHQHSSIIVKTHVPLAVTADPVVVLYTASCS